MYLKLVLFTLTSISGALCAAAAFAAPVQEGAPDPTLTTIDRSIEQRMRDARLVGLAAAIVVDHRVVWKNGYGFADKERALPFTAGTIMNIGSISKTVTGAALMRAVQDGKLSLDENINRYLPFKVANPRFPTEPVTLRQLATHTSSITDRGSIYASAYHFGRDSPERLGSFLKDYFASSGRSYSPDNFVDAKPGTHREYSNVGAALAGYMVERVAGEPLNVYTKRTIFKPLGMRDTGWFLSEVDLANHATLYVGQGLSIPIQQYGLTTYPDGGLRTSVENLSRFFIALLNDGVYEGVRILERKSVDEMLRLQYSDANKPDNVILSGENAVNSGIFWATKENVTRFGHNGADPGLVTMMLSDAKKRFGVILFVNTAVAQEDGQVYGSIFDDLWRIAEGLANEQRNARKD